MLKSRFRKYLPVVVDIETGGFDPNSNAILEIAITLIEEKDKIFLPGETHRYHIKPFEGSVVEKESLEFTKIKLDHPLRNAVEESLALKELFKIINITKNKYECSRAILVGHNAHFDKSFLDAAVLRNNIKKLHFINFLLLILCLLEFLLQVKLYLLEYVRNYLLTMIMMRLTQQHTIQK